MDTFLHQAAVYLKENYGKKLSSICVILPGERGTFFLREALAKLYEKPFFAPTIYTIETFLQTLTQQDSITREELLTSLFKIHLQINREINPDFGCAFSDFAPTGEMMLADFNDIDSYLLDAQTVFSSLTAIKELYFFGKTEAELSDFQRNYLLFFRRLGTYYQRLTEQLRSENKATQGMQYRIAAQHIADSVQRLPFAKYVFLGFNALTKAEECIVGHLKEIQKLDYIVDADRFYVNSPLHEAGRFIKAYQKSIFEDANMAYIGNYFAQSAKQVTVVGVPQAVSQTKVINGLRAEIEKKSDKTASTAIVLADEMLLMPLLHAIDVSEANITMGYPIRQTVACQMLSDLLTMLDNREKIRKSNANQAYNSLYFRDLDNFLNHPYIRELLNPHSTEQPLRLHEKIIGGSKTFYTQQDFIRLLDGVKEEMKDLLIRLLYETSGGESYVQLSVTLLRLIHDMLDSQSAEQEAVYRLGKYLLCLQEHAAKIESSDRDSFRFLFEHFLNAVSLSFESDPHARLQIMGLLETRTLDFENVIILSVNEGIIPVGRLNQSFIPYDVKQHFQLPTHRAKDAIFAYHFYRLLQRANNIYLVYNLDAKEGKAEKSRFLLQLENELKAFPNIVMTNKVMTYPTVKPSSKAVLRIPKTAETVRILRQYSYSASAINMFLSCGLRFYFSRILKIDENSISGENHTTHTLPSHAIGTAVHYVLEHAVKDGKFVMLTDKQIEQLVFQSLSQEPFAVHAQDLQYEKNHLIFKIIVKYASDYLQTVSRKNDFHVQDVERAYHGSLTVNHTLIALKGIIDRVDLRQGERYICDYKSGRVENGELKIKSLSDLFDGQHEKAFQLLFYAWLYHQETQGTNMQAEIISMRRLSGRFLLSIDGETRMREDILDDFAAELSHTIAQILDPDIPFSAAEKKEKCLYCPYTSVCKR